MASSGDYSYNPSTYQIITGAMRLIGAIQSGEVPPAEEYDDALASLNGVIHGWQANGLHVWTQTTYFLSLTAGKEVYSIGIGAPDYNVMRPLKVTEARFVVGALDEVPMIPLSKWDYANIKDKFVAGTPTQFFYDPQLPFGEFFVYPSPASSGTVNFIGQRPLQSFDTQRDTADLPQEWISALRFALAVELGPEYDVPAERLKIIKELSDEKLAIVKAWDVQPAGTSTLPFTQAVYNLIAGALRLCGGAGAQETPVLGLINNGFFALNALIQSWQASGMHVWTQTTYTLPITVGQAQYQIGLGATDLSVQRPLKVTEARLILGNNETPLIPMSRWDYANLSGKAVPPGPPDRYFYDPQLPNGVFTVYPTPAVGGTVRFVGQRQLQTLSDLTSDIDFPPEWNAAIRFNLALEMWGEHAERRAATKGDYNIQAIAGIAKEKLDVVKAWDVEAAGTTTLPFSQAVYQLIAGALRLCGGCGPQDTPTLGLINNGFYSLNAMVQQWQGMGIHLWTERDATLFLMPGQRVYRLGVGSPDHCCATSDWIQSYLFTTAPAGAATIVLNDATGIAPNDHIAILLDALPPVQPARYFWTIVAAVSGNTITLGSALPSQASSGARVISYTDDLPRPLKAPAARRIVYAGNLGIPSKIETPLQVFSRIDYSYQTNKDSPGAITGYFFDPQLGFAEFSTWPNPGDANQAIQFTAQLPLKTFADLTTADNFPVEWLNAIRYCLAVELWPEHAERRAAVKGDYNIQLLKGLADEKLMMAQAFDREPESVMFGVQQTYPATRNT